MIPHSSHKKELFAEGILELKIDSKSLHNLRVIMNLLEVWLLPGGGKCPLANPSPHQP